MESEHLFDEIIEYDAGCSSDKENEEISEPIRQPRTTIAQFKTIALFIQEHEEEHLDKATYDSLWDNLAAKLNDMGPPDHTTSEWRRIWSVHKYTNKRKRFVESGSGKQEHFDRLVSPAVENRSHEFSEILDVITSNQSELSEKIDVVIGNQKEMITNQKIMIQELKNSNTLLQEIAKKS